MCSAPSVNILRELGRDLAQSQPHGLLLSIHTYEVIVVVIVDLYISARVVASRGLQLPQSAQQLSETSLVRTFSGSHSPPWQPRRWCRPEALQQSIDSAVKPLANTTFARSFPVTRHAAPRSSARSILLSARDTPPPDTPDTNAFESRPNA